MKNISNNSTLSRLSVLMNILILVAFVVSMVLLRNFDKINIEYVRFAPTHDAALDALRSAEQPTRLDSATVAHYQYRVDTLTAKPMPRNSKDAKALTDEIQRVSGILAEKQETKRINDSVVMAKRDVYGPIQTKYENLKTETAQANSNFSIAYTICWILLLIKIIVFATWNYKNTLNIRNVAAWSKKGTSPYWAYLGWIIPVYNFVKPFTFFTELWDDTDYLLRDKGILPGSGKMKDDNTDLYLGLWWGFLLISIILITLFIHGTFFTTGPLFIKLNHMNVIIVSIVSWTLYLFLESFLMFRYDKMNKLLIDNSSKL